MLPTKLTDAAVRSLAPAEKDRIVYEPGGLGVRITPNGRKSFVVQARVNGQRRRFPIGAVSAELNVKAARDRAAIIKAELAGGLDPVAEQAKRQDAEKAERDRQAVEAQREREAEAAAGVTLGMFWTDYEARAKREVQPITLKSYAATRDDAGEAGPQLGQRFAVGHVGMVEHVAGERAGLDDLQARGRRPVGEAGQPPIQVALQLGERQARGCRDLAV